MEGTAGIYDAAAVAGLMADMPGACPYCSGPSNGVFHGGACPRIKAIEYHPNGTVKRVELGAARAALGNDEGASTTAEAARDVGPESRNREARAQ